KPQISPLRCAPVEMTKGRAALPATVVAEQDPFLSPWVGLWPMTPPVEMTKGRAALPATVVAEQDPFFITLTSPAQGRTADTADLSTTLRSGQDDKGEDGAASDSSCGTGPVFHQLDFSGPGKD